MYWILFLVFPLVTGRSAGPPKAQMASLCHTLEPQHQGAVAQQSQNYGLNVRALGDGSYEVSVNGDVFKGLMLQARNFNGNTATGQFIQVPSSGFGIWTCPGNNSPNTVVHAGAAEKRNSRFVWVPDATSGSTITFLGSAVKSFSEIAKLRLDVNI